MLTYFVSGSVNCTPSLQFYYFKNGHPRQPLFSFYRLFEQTFQFLQKINAAKCPSRIWCWDSNPHPLEQESPPITTRQGHLVLQVWIILNNRKS